MLTEARRVARRRRRRRRGRRHAVGRPGQRILLRGGARLDLAARGPVIPNFGGATHCVANNDLFCTTGCNSTGADTLQPALVQHLKLTAIAVGIGFGIAFAAALVAHRLPASSSTVRSLLRAPLHDPEHRALPAARARDRAHGDDGRDRASSATRCSSCSGTSSRACGAEPDGCSRPPAAWVDAVARSSGASSCRLPLPAIFAGIRIAVVTTSAWRRWPRSSPPRALANRSSSALRRLPSRPSSSRRRACRRARAHRSTSCSCLRNAA